MGKLSKDSLERPRFMAENEEISKDKKGDAGSKGLGSDGIITPDKLLQDMTKNSKDTDSRGKLGAFTSSKDKDFMGMGDDGMPMDYQDDMGDMGMGGMEMDGEFGNVPDVNFS